VTSSADRDAQIDFEMRLLQDELASANSRVTELEDLRDVLERRLAEQASGAGLRGPRRAADARGAAQEAVVQQTQEELLAAQKAAADKKVRRAPHRADPIRSEPTRLRSSCATALGAVGRSPRAGMR
jgi:hypothetical protein